MSTRDEELFYKMSLRTLLSEAPEDEDEEETEEETEEEAEEPSVEKKGSFENSLDADLDAIFIDFESGAREAVVQSENHQKTVKMLYEEADIDEINIQDFASNVARLVKNYENLLDMESILVSRAGEFLEDRYGEEAKRSLENELEQTHDIEITNTSKLDGEMQVPLAIGASASEG